MQGTREPLVLNKEQALFMPIYFGVNLYFTFPKYFSYVQYDFPNGIVLYPETLQAACYYEVPMDF